MGAHLYDLRHAWDGTARLRAYSKPGKADRPWPPAPNDLVDAEDISRATGMTIRWVYDVFAIPAKGGIRPIKIGGKSRWRYVDVLTWIELKHRESV